MFITNKVITKKKLWTKILKKLMMKGDMENNKCFSYAKAGNEKCSDPGEP